MAVKMADESRAVSGMQIQYAEDKMKRALERKDADAHRYWKHIKLMWIRKFNRAAR
jgi:hypothetical protein